MDFLEYIWYESLPYGYAALSGYVFFNMDQSKVAGLAAIVLAFCSYQVFIRRYNHRYKSSKNQNR